jgi:hypothetical protein
MLTFFYNFAFAIISGALTLYGIYLVCFGSGQYYLGQEHVSVIKIWVILTVLYSFVMTLKRRVLFPLKKCTYLFQYDGKYRAVKEDFFESSFISVISIFSLIMIHITPISFVVHTFACVILGLVIVYAVIIFIKSICCILQEYIGIIRERQQKLKYLNYLQSNNNKI